MQEDDVHALLILAERELLAFARIAKGLWCDARILRDDLAITAHRFHTGDVAHLEFVDEGKVH